MTHYCKWATAAVRAISACAAAGVMSLASIASAEEAKTTYVDLTPQAVVVHNYVPSYVQRGGRPTVFGVGSKLTDPRNRRGEAPVGKYAEESFVELWFPYAEPVTVNRLRFRMGNHRPVRHRVQAWDGAAWRTVVRVDESNPVGTDIRFEPVAPRGIRLLIDKTYYIGFDTHRLGGVAVFGPVSIDERMPKTVWNLSTERELNIFELGEDVVVKARLDAPADCRLSWEWLDWYLRPVANGGSRELTTPNQTFRRTPQAQGPFFLRSTLWRHHAVASQALLLVGVRDAKLAESLEVAPYRPKRGGRVRDEADLIGARRMVFSSEIYHHMSRLHYLPPEVWFQQFAKSEVDIVDLAERHGLRLEAGFWRYWFSGPNRPHWWLEDELIVDHTGKPGSGFEHAFSCWARGCRSWRATASSGSSCARPTGFPAAATAHNGRSTPACPWPSAAPAATPGRSTAVRSTRAGPTRSGKCTT